MVETVNPQKTENSLRLREFLALASPNLSQSSTVRVGIICVQRDNIWHNLVTRISLEPGSRASRAAEPCVVELPHFRAFVCVLACEDLPALLEGIEHERLDLPALRKTLCGHIQLPPVSLTEPTLVGPDRTTAYGISMPAYLIYATGEGIDRIVPRNLWDEISARLPGLDPPFSSISTLVRELRIGDGLQPYMASHLVLISPFWLRFNRVVLSSPPVSLGIEVLSYWEHLSGKAAVSVIPQQLAGSGNKYVTEIGREGWTCKERDDGAFIYATAVPLSHPVERIDLHLVYEGRRIDSSSIAPYSSTVAPGHSNLSSGVHDEADAKTERRSSPDSSGGGSAHSNGRPGPSRWMSVAGAVFGGCALLFFMTLIAVSIAGWEVPSGSRFLVVIVLALGAALSVSFLGGTAAAHGSLRLPRALAHPMRFGITGGCAVLFLALILGYWLYVYPASRSESTDALLTRVQDHSLPQAARLEALQTLLNVYHWKDFKRKNLSGLRLPNTSWEGVDLTDARMTDCILRGVNLQGAILVRADLTRANLQGADLRDVYLNGALLSACDCQTARFNDAEMRFAKMNDGQFQGASFRSTKLEATILSGAILDGADLWNATFNDSPGTPGAYWTDLTGASLVGTSLEQADLRGTKGVEKAILRLSTYDQGTKFPEGFDPDRAGMILR